jgi:glycosyltransferase involved in cell wall biosynthesis
MRLLYLVDHWPGLFEAYLLREMQWMRQRGHHVAVLSLGLGGPHGFRDETRDHVELAEFGLEDVPVLQLEARGMRREQIVQEAAAFADRQETELIDAHLAREPAEVACRIHHFSGTPFAVRLRGGDVHSNPSPMIEEIAQYAAAVCPMSQFLADVLVGRRGLKKIPQGLPVKVEPGKLHVVPNSLPAKYLSPNPVPQSDQQQVIGAVGRLVPVKRFPDLIEAVARLAPDFPGLRLKIVGGGVVFAELQALASRLCMADRIEITGFQSWHSVMTMVRQFHVYIQTSELEGCSLANIEAGFQGIPLLLSRTGANEQCVEPEVNGYLFDPGDVTGLSERLRRLLLAGARKREQMGKASLDIVGARFSAEKVMPLLETVFQDAINNATPGRMSFSTPHGLNGGKCNG